jgi:signal recognition particle subunit SRP54
VRVAETFQADLSADGMIVTKMDGDRRGRGARSRRHGRADPLVGTGEGSKTLELPSRPMASRILGMGCLAVEKAEQALDEESARVLEARRRVHARGLSRNARDPQDGADGRLLRTVPV